MTIKRPLISALVALTLLPAVAFAGASGAWMIIGQVAPLEAADKLADKGMAAWFLALAAIAIGSWTWVFRWMVSQLEAQRAANAELVRQILEYHKSDNTSLRDMLGQTTAALNLVASKL